MVSWSASCRIFSCSTVNLISPLEKNNEAGSNSRDDVFSFGWIDMRLVHNLSKLTKREACLLATKVLFGRKNGETVSPFKALSSCHLSPKPLRCSCCPCGAQAAEGLVVLSLQGGALFLFGIIVIMHRMKVMKLTKVTS